MDSLGGFANYTAAELAARTLSSARTARRWIYGGLAPRLVVAWLRLTAWGELGSICRQWDGWTLRGGKLHSPEGDAFTPGEVRAIPLRYQQIAIAMPSKRS